MFVTIRAFLTPSEAYFLQSVLDAEGIFSLLKDEHTVVTTPFLANAIGGIKLMVYEDDAQAAFEILSQRGFIRPDPPKQSFFKEHKGMIVLAIVLFVLFIYNVLLNFPQLFGKR